jgi:hypothetical protein
VSVDRRFRLPRLWSNRELRRIAFCFGGDIVNVSAWDDRDKEGGHYKDYFVNASSYSYTNHAGYRGFQGRGNEYPLDLTGEVPNELKQRFDVVFNHTTLEHIFDVRKAFANLCELSKDVTIVIAPFAQVQHESDEWKDFWRFTPACLRRLHEENGLTVVYEAESPHSNSGVYLLSVGSRHPDCWRTRLPPYEPICAAGRWIGLSVRDVVRKHVNRVLGKRGSDKR